VEGKRGRKAMQDIMTNGQQQTNGKISGIYEYLTAWFNTSDGIS
jgi:hypothetical protein